MFIHFRHRENGFKGSRDNCQYVYLLLFGCVSGLNMQNASIEKRERDHVYAKISA